MKYKLGFIGCGNMGGALITAAAKTLQKGEIAVCDLDKDKVTALEKAYGVVGVDIQTIATQADFIVLGVKPQVMEKVVSPLSPLLKGRTDVTVITMAAGVSIAAVRKFIGENLPVVRIMPNTPVAVGEGMILYVLDGVDESAHKAFRAYFEKAGQFDQIEENKIDGASALSGCGPAFVYAFAEALADGAVECGVPRASAALYAAQTLKGAAEMLLQFGHPADLKDAVCSPGGTTIAGVHALEDGGFRGTVMDAITAAYERTLELKK